MRQKAIDGPAGCVDIKRLFMAITVKAGAARPTLAFEFLNIRTNNRMLDPETTPLYERSYKRRI